jgi:hypothetical protein
VSEIAQTHETVHIPEIKLSPKAASVERVAGVVGGLGLLLCLAGAISTPATFFQSYLFAFLYWAGFGFGGLGILLLNNVVGGKWGATARRFLVAQMRTLPVIGVFFVVLLFGLKYIYPWTHPDLVSANEYLHHKAPYLNVPFFLIRAVIYFAIMIGIGMRLSRWYDEQDRTGDFALREKLRAFSAPCLLLFVLTATFAVIDWLLSADAQYYSTVYGGMILIGDVVQTFALTNLTLILASKGDRFGSRINAPILHDLGNLMFAFTIFWAYLSASQLIITWPANLPQEISWYLDRTNGFWKVLAVVIAVSMFLIPFLALLSQGRKRDPRRLMKVAIWLLCARVIDLFWVVEPTFRNHSAGALLGTSNGFQIYWTDFAAFFGLGGVWVFMFIKQLRRSPLLPLRDGRVQDPRPQEVLA